MKLIITLLLMFISTQLNAQVYHCQHKGRSTYSQTPQGKHCVPAQLNGLSSYAAPKIHVQATQTDTRQIPANTQNTPRKTQTPDDAIKQAESNLKKAEKALADGMAKRMGNERNFKRYQQRIAKLEAKVETAKQKLDEAKNTANAQ